jgi:hypothetical protein
LDQTEPQTEQNLQVFAQQHEPEPVPEQPISTTSLGRFKQLDADALLEIEQNQYSAATKKNTKWLFRNWFWFMLLSKNLEILLCLWFCLIELFMVVNALNCLQQHFIQLLLDMK